MFLQGKYSEVNVMLSPRSTLNSGVKSVSAKENTGTLAAKLKEVIPQSAVQERPRTVNENTSNRVGSANNNSGAPAPK